MNGNIGQESIDKMHEWMRLQRGEKNTNFYLTTAILYLADRVAELERKSAERNRAFKAPDAKEVTEYAKSIGFDLDGSTFCDFYEARNWFVGKVKMRSWKAAVRTWKARRNEMPSKPVGRLPDNLRDDHGL